jgi:hypothetical protein
MINNQLLNQLLSLISVLFFHILIIFCRMTTYLRICHEKYIYHGKYDYKLWLAVMIASITFSLININNHGSRKYWYVLRSFIFFFFFFY